MKAYRRPPGPPQRWLSGSFREFRRDSLGFMRRCAREYGDIAWFRFGRRPIILVSDPEMIETVLVKQSRNFIKHFALRLTRFVLGNGLLTSEGDFWLRQRRLSAPAFHAQRIAGYGPDMVAAATRHMATWRDGETRDIHADMMQLTLDIAAKTFFGADVSDESREVDVAIRTALDSFAKRLNRTIPLPVWIPLPRNRKFHAALGALNQVVGKIIEQRRADATPRNDLLSILIHSRDEDDGSSMTFEQLADEARTFLLAGHETTALVLSWSWHLLARHPQAQARLAAELGAVLGDRPPAVEDLPRLKYAEQVILESMRMFPPAFVIGREALEDFELGGFTIPAGTTVLMSQWVVHHDERFYDRPEQFEPERWSSERMKTLPKMAYFPFGGGPRICIGNTFALMESVLVLSEIARRWSFAAAGNEPLVLSPIVTLRPRDPVRVVISSRREQTPRGPALPGAQAAAKMTP
jgi:cytochrome P450